MRSHPDIINHVKLRDKLRLVDTRRVVASICHNVLLTSDVTPLKSILVCSADAGEGASTVAVGLALAAAEQQSGPVWLTDGNFHQPGVLAALSKFSALGGDKVELELNCRIFPLAQWMYKQL